MWPVYPTKLSKNTEKFDLERQSIIDNLHKYNHTNIIDFMNDLVHEAQDDIIKQLIDFDFEEFDTLIPKYTNSKNDKAKNNHMDDIKPLDQSDIDVKKDLTDKDKLTDLGLKVISEGKGKLTSRCCNISSRRCKKTRMRRR